MRQINHPTQPTILKILSFNMFNFLLLASPTKRPKRCTKLLPIKNILKNVLLQKLLNHTNSIFLKIEVVGKTH